MGAETEVRVCSDFAPNAPAVQCERVGRDADAVCIHVFRLHLVPEEQGIPVTTARRERSPARLTAHVERQSGASGSLDPWGESDPDRNPFARAVGCAVRGAAGNPCSTDPGNGRRAAVDLVIRSTASRWPSKDERRIRTVSRLDAAAVKGQRTGRDVDAVRVSVLRLHHVMEFQALVPCLANTPRSVAAPGYPT